MALLGAAQGVFEVPGQVERGVLLGRGAADQSRRLLLGELPFGEQFLVGPPQLDFRGLQVGDPLVQRRQLVRGLWYALGHDDSLSEVGGGRGLVARQPEKCRAAPRVQLLQSVVVDATPRNEVTVTSYDVGGPSYSAQTTSQFSG